jgi:hypothetical protein
MVVLVLRQAKGANAAGASAFQTKEIAFAFVRDSVNLTWGKELCRQQWLQPSWLLSLWMILAVVSFDPYRTALSIANTIVNSQHLNSRAPHEKGWGNKCTGRTYAKHFLYSRQQQQQQKQLRLGQNGLALHDPSDTSQMFSFMRQSYRRAAPRRYHEPQELCF